MHAQTIKTIWTIGHSTRTADEFLSLLRESQNNRLADIRTIPQSRRHPHFGREILAASLESEGIQYRHFPELGGLRKPRPDSPNGAWKHQAFRGYADHMLTPAFGRAIEDLVTWGPDGPDRNDGRVVVMCAEAVWWKCHRMLLSDALVARGVTVRHILSYGSTNLHKLTSFAAIRPDSSVWYPETKRGRRESN